jgi:hypothetical protein
MSDRGNVIEPHGPTNLGSTSLSLFLAIRQLCFFVWAAPRIPATATQKRTMSYNSQRNLQPVNESVNFFHMLCSDPVLDDSK